MGFGVRWGFPEVLGPVAKRAAPKDDIFYTPHCGSVTMSKFFKVEARALLTLGRDSIKDHTTAVVELVKNSYDAGATVVEIEIRANAQDRDRWFIRISDNGVGMTEDDVEKKWLRIGFSDKRVEKFVGDRRRVGEKGIGRLSADRLGSTLELRSQAKDAAPVGLKVEWDRFDVIGEDLAAIPLQTLEKITFDVPVPAADEQLPSGWAARLA